MNSFAVGAAKHQSDSAYCCTLAGAHNSSSSSGTTEVAAHAMPTKMDAKRGTSDAWRCTPLSVQGEISPQPVVVGQIWAQLKKAEVDLVLPAVLASSLWEGTHALVNEAV